MTMWSESRAVICSYLDNLQWPAYTDLRYDSVPLKTIILAIYAFIMFRQGNCSYSSGCFQLLSKKLPVVPKHWDNSTDQVSPISADCP